MKSSVKSMSLAMGLLIAGTMSVGTVSAGQQQLLPVPDYSMGTGTIVSGQPMELFTRVKYTDRHEMAPCAVTKIVRVNDPCACHDPCNCCGPKCVYIQICVPPCACESVRSRKNGDRVRYDYGKYAVDVRVKNGYIEVDYQD